VSGAFPLIGLNIFGDTLMTISGEYLPHNLETSTVFIKFSDDYETTCVAQVTSTSELVCLTSAFHYSIEDGASLQMVIVINGQTVANSITVTMSEDSVSVMSMIPSSVSPVLKTKIVVEIGSDFPYTLFKEDLTMNAISTNDSSYIRYLRVVEVDDATKTFTALFGGAYSG